MPCRPRPSAAPSRHVKDAAAPMRHHDDALHAAPAGPGQADPVEAKAGGGGAAPRDPPYEDGVDAACSLPRRMSADEFNKMPDLLDKHRGSQAVPLVNPPGLGVLAGNGGGPASAGRAGAVFVDAERRSQCPGPGQLWHCSCPWPCSLMAEPAGTRGLRRPLDPAAPVAPRRESVSLWWMWCAPGSNGDVGLLKKLPGAAHQWWRPELPASTRGFGALGQRSVGGWGDRG